LIGAQTNTAALAGLLREHGPGSGRIAASYAQPADQDDLRHLTLSPIEDYENLDALVVAVSHKEYIQLGQSKLLGMVRDGGCFVDVKSVFTPTRMERGVQYLSL
jgi:UDP-N-acetyl-D-galactosamine dehydrogenase